MPGCRAWTGSRGGELELSAGEKGGRRKFPLVVLSGWHQRERSVGPLSLKAKDSQRRIPKGRGRRGQIPIGPGQASGLRVWVLAQEQVGNFRHCWDKEQEKGQGLVNEMGAEGGGGTEIPVSLQDTHSTIGQLGRRKASGETTRRKEKLALCNGRRRSLLNQGQACGWVDAVGWERSITGESQRPPGLSAPGKKKKICSKNLHLGPPG